MSRIVSWFSCGAASAVAAKLAIMEYGHDVVDVVYCNTMANEHQDNARFFADVEKWIGKPITTIESRFGSSVETIFDNRKYMSGPMGAPCTVELKKVPRFNYQSADDIHIFGYTADEGKRIERFVANNPELYLDWILHRKGFTKDQCFGVLKYAGIRLPVMYSLGYKNNNCLGCVKASAPKYWNAIRRDFPEVFARRAEQSRRLGARLTRAKNASGKWQHIFLDELSESANDDFREDLSCGPECRGK